MTDTNEVIKQIRLKITNQLEPAYLQDANYLAMLDIWFEEASFSGLSIQDWAYVYFSEHPKYRIVTCCASALNCQNRIPVNYDSHKEVYWWPLFCSDHNR